MNRGIILIAHNNEKYDYFRMACHTAGRVQQYLNLPVSIITDKNSITQPTYIFDNIIFKNPNKNNIRKKTTWLNKNRYEIYDLSPYDDTLLIDVDYLINSNLLLKAFETDNDFICHKHTYWIFKDNFVEYLYPSTIPTLWATVLRFKKTLRAKQIFQMMQMVQDNYEHYASIYKFLPFMYRNDYALTIALKTVNGHLENNHDYFQWKLIHIDDTVKINKIDETAYALTNTDVITNKSNYIKIKNTDIHIINKQNFLDLIE